MIEDKICCDDVTARVLQASKISKKHVLPARETTPLFAAIISLVVRFLFFSF